MPKFFINENQINENRVFIDGDTASHLIKVLRIKTGEEIIVNCQNGFDYFCEVNYVDKQNVECEVIKKEPCETESDYKITLFQGLPKGDKLEMIIQKTVELGVFEIVPVNTKYAVVKSENIDKKNLRLNKISEEASKQCMRGIIPNVANVINFNEVINQIKNFDLFFVCYEKQDNAENLKKDLQNIFNGKSDVKNIGIFIGAEGGFSEEEILRLKENGCNIVSLGKRILRTETAGIMFLSVLMYELECV